MLSFLSRSSPFKRPSYFSKRYISTLDRKSCYPESISFSSDIVIGRLVPEGTNDLEKQKIIREFVNSTRNQHIRYRKENINTSIEFSGPFDSRD